MQVSAGFQRALEAEVARLAHAAEGKNQIGRHYYDKRSNLGGVDINGAFFPIHKIHKGYKADLETSIYAYIIEVANNYNQSAPFKIEAKTFRGLIGKVKRHKYKLVKPYGRR